MNNNDKLRTIFAILNKLGWESKEVYSEKIQKQTIGKYDSISALLTNADAANSFIASIKAEESKRQRMGNKVLYYLRLLGYISPNGSTDMDRINGYIEGIGSKNPDKKQLWKLGLSEMQSVLKQIEARYKASINNTKN